MRENNPALRWQGLAVLLTLLVFAAGCSLLGGSSSTGGGSSVGNLSVFLTDAPTNDLAEVNVTITAVEVHRDGSWHTLNEIEDGLTINLLDLRFTDELLGTATLPAGAYTQIRLIVDDSDIDRSNVVDTGGTKSPLKVPSGAQTGLKIHHDFTVPAGGTTALTLDANVLEFVHPTGAGFYIVNPTAVRVVSTTQSGSVRAIALDALTSAAITTVDVIATLRLDANADGVAEDVNGDGAYDPATDYVARTLALRTDSTDGAGEILPAGTFQFNAIPTGNYIVEVSAGGYQTQTMTGVQVKAGETTQVDGQPALAGINPILLQAEVGP